MYLSSTASIHMDQGKARRCMKRDETRNTMVMTIAKEPFEPSESSEMGSTSIRGEAERNIT